MTQQSQALDEKGMEAARKKGREIAGNQPGALVEAFAETAAAGAVAYLAALGGTPAKQGEAERIADATLSWMVKHDYLDAGREYHAQDVVAVLDALRPDSRASFAADVAALSQHQVAAEPTGPVEGPTYYTEGKDAPWFETLSDIEFAWQAEKAAMDLVDMDTGVLEEYIPFIAIISEAAERVNHARDLLAAAASRFALQQGQRS